MPYQMEVKTEGGWLPVDEVREEIFLSTDVAKDLIIKTHKALKEQGKETSRLRVVDVIAEG